MLPAAVSQGKTPRSWNTKMRRGSGPRTSSPSIEHPAGGGREESADHVQQRRLAAAGGPQDADELALADVEVQAVEDVGRLVVGGEGHAQAFDADLRSAAGGSRRAGAGAAALLADHAVLRRVAPAHRGQAVEAPDREVEQQSDDADQHHARDHQVVAVAGVAGVDDQEAQARS